MYRVIIADDEPKVALLIRNLIQWDDLGLELVATASDGIAALAAIETLQPDIVITDIRMPGYDGIELIERAKRHNPAIDFIIISGYRHFDYAQKAIRFGVEDYLLKPLKAVEINQTLGKMIEKHRVRDLAREREARYSAYAEKDTQVLQERFLVTALGLGDAESEDVSLSLEMLNQKYTLSLQPHLFQVIVVKADIGPESLGASVRRLLAEKAMGAIRDAVKGLCRACLLYPGEQGVYGLLNFDELQKKALRKALLGVIDDLQSQSEIFDRIKVTVGLGRQSDSIHDVRLSAEDAELAVLDRLVQGTGRVLERPVADNRDLVVAQIISADVRKRLLQGVEILDTAVLASAIDDLTGTASRYAGMTGKAVLAVFDECAEIVRFGLRAQSAVDAQVDAMQSATLEKLGMCHSQREVFQLLRTYAASLVGHVVALRKSESAKPVRDAQKFIQTNFASPIGLESVSEQVGFNPTYFSVVFKKETGMNFLEYLTDVRIREAKRLLSDPRKTIADVALEVGYNDVKHFSRVFTRSTGLHPSKYRKLYY